MLCAITGSYGFAIKPEHMLLRIGLKTDAGSTFIESLTRQQNYRWLLETTPPGDTTVNRPYLYKELLTEWKMKNIDKIINDGGMEISIKIATEQAIQTYLGMPVLIDPDQNHDVAIKVKKSFLADRKSVWNTHPQYAQYGQLLVQQIEMHFAYLQMQMLQMQLQQQRMMLGEGDALQPLQSQQPSRGNQIATTPGQAAQQKGGQL